MAIVIDCSAAVQMAFATPLGDALARKAAQTEALVAPHIFVEEMTCTIWKYIRSGRISFESGVEMLKGQLSQLDHVMDTRPLAPEVLALSTRTGHSPYDLFYFVLAKRMAAPLMTLDWRLAKLCEENGVVCITGDGR